MKRDEIAERYQLDRNKPWILIPENYGAAFYTDSIINEKISRGINARDVMDYKKFAQDSLKILVNWCFKACSDESVEIVFRPRPATPISKMLEYFKSDVSSLPRNLHIIKDYSVREWILACDLVMSSYSTTLIEAAVAEKPISMLAPIPFPEYLQNDWYRLVPQITSYNEFIESIRNYSPEMSLALKQWTDSTFLRNGDPIQGIIRILLQIPDIEIWASDSPEFKKTSPLDDWRIFPKILARLAISLNKPLIEDYENDFFTHADVTRKMEEWEKVLKY